MNRPVARARARPHGGRWRRRHGEAARGAVRRLRERPGSHLFALALLALALLALLLLRLGLDQAQRLAAPLGEARSLSLFLDPALDADAVAALAAELAADDRVAAVDAISPEQGLAELTRLQGDNGVLAALPDNPLPWVLAVEPADRDLAATLAGDWRQRPEVDHLADEADWHDRAEAVLAAARAAFIVLAALVALAALLLAANAVRTIRVEGRDERALQRVFGATEADLRRPYLYLGGLYGAVSGAAATVAMVILMLALRPAFVDLGEIFALPSDTRASVWPWLLLCPLLAALLGALGAWLGCRFEPDLEVSE